MSVTAELVVSAFSRCWVWKQIKIIIIFEYYLLYKKYKLIDLLTAYLGTIWAKTAKSAKSAKFFI